jgi:tetratricopeptide (TPR) repeat protein
MKVTSTRSFAAIVLTAAVAALLTGCAEPLTYSQDFKHNGLAQYNRGEYLDAAGSFKAAAKQDPTDYMTQYYLGLSDEKSGQFESAVSAFRLCLKLRPAMPAGRADVATREKVLAHLAPLIARGDFADPEINAIQTEAAAEHLSEDYRLLARVHALRGDADSAITCYKDGFTYAPEDFPLAKEYGFYLLKMDQTADGTRILKKAWQLDPTDRQVASALRELGVTDSQLIVRSDRIEAPEPATTPQTAWDASIAPR